MTQTVGRFVTCWFGYLDKRNIEAELGTLTRQPSENAAETKTQSLKGELESKRAQSSALVPPTTPISPTQVMKHALDLPRRNTSSARNWV